MPKSFPLTCRREYAVVDSQSGSEKAVPFRSTKAEPGVQRRVMSIFAAGEFAMFKPSEVETELEGNLPDQSSKPFSRNINLERGWLMLICLRSKSFKVSYTSPSLWRGSEYASILGFRAESLPLR